LATGRFNTPRAADRPECILRLRFDAFSLGSWRAPAIFAHCAAQRVHHAALRSPIHEAIERRLALSSRRTQRRLVRSFKIIDPRLQHPQGEQIAAFAARVLLAHVRHANLMRN